MAINLAINGCIAVCTAAVRVTTSKVGVSGVVTSGTLGSGVNVAACAGWGAEPETVRLLPVMGAGHEVGAVARFPMVRPSSLAVLRKRSMLHLRMVFFKTDSSCCCLMANWSFFHS